MNTSNNTIQDFMKAKFGILKNWLIRYAKVVMPVVLVICVLITVVIAVNANKKKEAEEETVEASEEVDMASSLIGVPEVPLEQDAVPEINELFHTYYQAMVDGDTDTMSKLVDHMDETEILKVQETSKYIEGYPTLEIYTKVGPKEGTYIAYVHGELKFYDYDKTVPGLSTYYVCQDEDGNYYINEDGEEDENELNYIREVNLQDDVIDLSNKVTVAYNDMLAEDEDLVNFILDLNTEIDKNVGEALAKAEGSEQTGDGDTETGEETESEDGSSEEAQAQTTEETQETVSTVTKVRTTDVVNIRKSDSETADKLGKAAEGDEFTLVEEKGNGWSQIEYNGETAYIKSEFLEPVETTEASANTSSDTDTASTTKTDTSSTTKTDTSSSSSSVTGTVTVKENVRVRASASENGEKLGTAYVGDKLDLIMKQADGWTKIKYNGQTAYVKSDYVE